MLLTEPRQKLNIDFQRFEKLLSLVCRLLDISVDIKSPEGEVIVCGPAGTHGKSCSRQEPNPGRCSAESLKLFRQIEKSGKTAVHKGFEDIEIIGIPLHCNRELVGILCACRQTDEGNIVDGATEFLEEIAARISCEIQGQFEIDTFAHELSDKYEELNLIYDLGKKLGGISSAKEAIYFIVEQSKEALNSHVVLASIPSKNIHEISYSDPGSLPIHVNNDKSFMDQIGDVIIERFTSSNIHPEHIVLNNIRNDMQLARLFDVHLGLLAVPVKLKGHVNGFLCVINFDPEKSFHTGDVRLAASLAQQISLALTNTELYQNLKDFLINVIKTLVYSIEAKDAYTRGHSDRVSTLTKVLAEHMDLSPAEKEALSWASILHDIGKIGVSEDILTKPGRLTEEEFLDIKQHPVTGYRILMPIEQLKDSLSGIHYHHERFDGKGYPLGLKGEEIPLNARIIAIADMYDAMTSDRSYRAKMSHADAITEIRRVKGSQLDPEIVDIFIRLFK